MHINSPHISTTCGDAGEKRRELKQIINQNALDLPELADVDGFDYKLVHLISLKLVPVCLRRLQINHSCKTTETKSSRRI